MKTNKFFALCLTALLFATSQNFALAQGGEQQVDPRMQDPLALYKMAGINADQEAEIRKLAKDFEDTQRVRVKSLLGLMKSLKALQLQADPPEAQVISTQEEVNKVTGEMATERMKLLLKVRKVLTPDQRKKLVAMLSEDQAAGQGQGKDGPDTGAATP